MEDCNPGKGLVESLVDWLSSLWDKGAHCNAT
jgi:hypothetical protein